MGDSPKFYPCENIPRLHFSDPRALQLVSQEKPVVLTDTKLCSAALKWDLDYLKSNIGNDKHVVYSSNNNKFKYFDENKIKNLKHEFPKPMEKHEMTFSEYLAKLKYPITNDKRYYLQQSLTSSIGSVIAADFVSFNWLWLNKLLQLVQWGPLTSNLLLVAMAGCITPVHYDEQQNLFCQLVGEKEFVLFSPDHHNRLYPHPVYHPHDRQSQVDMEHPDFERFPGLGSLHGHTAVVGPGDVLYIPIYWWHQVTSPPSQPYTVSLNFWYKGGSDENVSYPLLPRQEVAIMRNIEKMVLEVFKDPEKVDMFFQSVSLGRYTSPGVALPLQLSSNLPIDFKDANFKLKTNSEDERNYVEGKDCSPGRDKNCGEGEQSPNNITQVSQQLLPDSRTLSQDCHSSGGSSPSSQCSCQSSYSTSLSSCDNSSHTPATLNPSST